MTSLSRAAATLTLGILCMTSAARGARADESKAPLTKGDESSSVAAPQPTPVDAHVPLVEEPAQHRWYGWQTLTVGYAWLGVALSAASAQADGVAYAGLAGYALGGPIVHLAHEQYWKALPSLALNIGLPYLGGTIGASSAHCGHTTDIFCGIAPVATGIIIGMALAPALDAALLGWEPKPSTERAKPQTGVRVQPTIAIAQKDAEGHTRSMLGLVGTF